MSDQHIDFDQFKKYAADFAKLYASEKEKTKHLEKTKQQLTKYAEDINKSFLELRTAHRQLKETNENLEQLVEERTAKLKQSNEELIKAKQAADDANRAKSDFLAIMSHELRTPMNAIIGMAHLALNTNLSPKQQDYLKKIDVSAKSLLGIINEILDFSKIEAGKLDLESVTFSPAEVLEKVSSIVGVTAREKGLNFFMERGEGVPEVLSGDPLRLGQVLINLCNNAVKFTDDGEVSVSTSLANEQGEHATLQFAVRDTGIGLSEHQIGRLFQSFTQMEASTTRKYGGTGLGLAICKRLVNMMDGDIWVESEPGKGSVFYFTAQFKKADETLVASKRATFEGSRRIKSIRGAHILVVEDNDMNQQIAKEILERAGFFVTIASNGKEGVRLVKEIPFDAVLMDIQMPVMDGFTATREIRKWEKKRFQLSGVSVSKVDENKELKPETRNQTPIIAMTAHALPLDREKSLKSGMDDHISKPFDPDELFSTLVKWIKPGVGGQGSGAGGQGSRIGGQVTGFEPVESLPNLAGIDTRKGLLLTGKNMDLYRNLLLQFRRTYADTLEEVQLMINNGDQESVCRTAHNIKGIAGNIGALALAEAAGKLELAARNRQHHDIETTLDAFKTALDQVLTSLKMVSANHRDAEQKPTDQIRDPADLLTLLKRLEPQLAKQSPQPCKEIMLEIKAATWSAAFTQDLLTLGKLIDTFKFKDARAVLTSLFLTHERLGETHGEPVQTKSSGC